MCVKREFEHNNVESHDANWPTCGDVNHGKPPPHTLQIELLAEGHVNYSALYEEEDVLKKSKKSNKATKTSITRIGLKDIISNDPHSSYYCGIDIQYEDLEKKIGWEINWSQDEIYMLWR